MARDGKGVALAPRVHVQSIIGRPAVIYPTGETRFEIV